MAGWAREPESTVMTARSSHAGTLPCWFGSCLVVALLAAPCGAQCGYEVTGVIRRTGIAGLAITDSIVDRLMYCICMNTGLLMFDDERLCCPVFQ